MSSRHSYANRTSRIDLNPHKADENEEDEAGDNPEAPQDGPAETNPDEQPSRQHRRLTSYLHGPLNARRMREASVEERLAALRSVREVNREDVEAAENADERQGRRSRLTARLRERFRIRTRPHDSPEPAGS